MELKAIFNNNKFVQSNLCILCFLLFLRVAVCQDYNPIVAPASPNADNLGKYGDINVSMYTGVPEINIELYTIDNGDIHIPIQLFYEPNANRIKNEASWVGLCWSLNAGGMISREKRGYCDETIDIDKGLVGSSTLLDNHQDEPDLFSYNFGEYSGQFVIKENGSIFEFEKSDLKIELIDDQGTGFLVYTPDGLIYEFSEAESSVVTELSGSFDPWYEYTSTWYLIKVSSPTGEEVNFTYDENVYPSTTTYTSFSWVKRLSESYSPLSCPPFDDELVGSQTQNSSTSIVESSNKYLEKIDFSGGSIEFLKVDRIDLQQSGDNQPKAIDKIKILNDKGDLLYSYNFLTSYFQSADQGEPYQINRLKLDGIEMISVDTQIDLYSFDYDETVNLPAKHSESYDFWGYYNGNEISGGSEPLGDANFSCANLIEKITFPTGGYSLFDWEINEFSNRTNVLLGGGNRIASIINSEGESRYYEYVIDEEIIKSSGKLIAGVNSTYEREDTYNSYDDDNLQCIVILTNKVSAVRGNYLGLTYGGAAVGYDRIVEYYGENGENGKKEYLYYNDDLTLPNGNDYNPNDIRQAPSLNGQKKKITTYGFDGLDFFEISSEEYFYKEVKNTYNVPVVDLRVGSYSGSCDDLLPCYRSFFSTVKSCSITSSMISPDYTVLKSKYDNNEVIEIESYLTNDLNQVTYEAKTNSDDKELVTKRKTVFDIEELYSDALWTWFDETYIQYLDLPSQAVWSLISNNQLNLPVETITEVDDKVTSAIFYEYAEFSNGLTQLSKVYELEIVEPITNFSSVFLDDDDHANIKKDSRYRLVMTINNYDENGNITEFTKTDNLGNSKIWGYDGQYQIAQVINATPYEIFHTSFDEPVTILGWANSTELSSVQVKTGLSSLKSTNSAPSSEIWHKLPMVYVDTEGTKKYIISCWVYSEGPSADLYALFYNGGAYTSSDYIQTTVTDKWVHLEKEITLPLNTSEIIPRVDNNAWGGGSEGIVYFDDIRVYPSDAQMTTYTYDPLIGMTSQTDPNGQTTFYEYDSFGRLWRILNQNRNILKQYDYHYINE